MQGTSLVTPIQLGNPGLAQKQVPEDVRDILKPTSERYIGPIDLDEAVAQRAEEVNRTWLASTGEDTTSVLISIMLTNAHAPVVMTGTACSSEAQSSL